MSVETIFSRAERAFVHPTAGDAPTWPTPGALARELDPATVQTPALDLIDAALVDVAEGRCQRLIISMPPQEGKSERTTHYGALWMLQRFPWMRVAIVSYDGGVAGDMSQKLRDDIVMFDGSDDGPNLGLRLRRDSKAVKRWSLAPPHRGGCYAIGIGGGLTSKPVEMMFIDDPVKDYKAADSESQSEDAWTWWQSVARPRLAPQAPVVLILTRWSQLDLAGRLLAKQAEDEAAGLEHYDRWRVINIPAQAGHDPAKGQTDPLDRQPGEYLKSARGRTQEQWEATKAASSSRIWNALYQGQPAPDAGDVWKRGWWRRYPHLEWSTDGATYLTDGFDELIQSWDLTFKDTQGSDYVCGLVLARRGADVLVLDAVHARMTFTESIVALTRMSARWPQASLKLIEDKANGPAVIDQLGSKIGGIVPVNPDGSKYARAVAVSPFLEAGNVWLPHSDVALFQPDDLIEEAAAFPRGAHDDWVDALSQGLRRLLLDGLGAAEWIQYMKDRAKEQADRVEAAEQPPELPPGVTPLEAARQAAFRARKEHANGF